MTATKQQKYWFKRRSHVWQPVSWQGWLTLLLFIAVVAGNASIVVLNPYTNELLWLYLNVLITSIGLLLFIGYIKGPESE